MKDDRKRERAVALLVKEARDHQTLRETIDVKNQDFLVVHSEIILGRCTRDVYGWMMLLLKNFNLLFPSK
jgi:hypothetical protein